MAKTIAEPRKEISKYAPRITTIKINPEKIGAVIGPQGKVIKGIVEGCLHLLGWLAMDPALSDGDAAEDGNGLVLGPAGNSAEGDEFADAGQVARLLMREARRTLREIERG